jgi:hypothetical protein
MKLGMALLDADMRLNRPLHVMEHVMATGGWNVDAVPSPRPDAECQSDVVRLAAGDSVSLPRPFVFRVEPREALAGTSCRDMARALSVNAGFGHAYEASAGGADMREVAYLGAAHLHIFIYDPVHDAVGRQGRDEKASEVRRGSHLIPQHAVLQGAADFSRIVRERKPRRPQQCPLVIVVTGLDERWESSPTGHSAEVLHGSGFGPPGDGMRAAGDVSRQVRAYLERAAPGLVTVAEHNWSDVTYLPCSVAGARPAGDAAHTRSASPQEPVGCDVPLLVGLAKALHGRQTDSIDDDPEVGDGDHP